MKAVLSLLVLALGFSARSCHAQQSRAQVAASVAVVEAIGVTAGATAVTRASGGTLDVTTPLSIRGSAPRVVQVVDAARPRSVATQLRPACPPAHDRPDACAVRWRLASGEAREGEKVLTYQIATIN